MTELDYEQHYEPVSTEPTPGWEFRESLLVLLSRAQRGRLTPADGDLLRSHVEHLLRHVDGTDEIARRLLEQRQEMAAERYAWQERGDKAEAERDQLAAAFDRVRAEHEPDGGHCGTCADHYSSAAPWPCPTIRALDEQPPTA